MALVTQTIRTTDERLSPFDLTEHDIHDVVVRPAQNAAAGVSPLAPSGFAGQTRHAHCVIGLRTLHMRRPNRWQIDNTGGVARTVNVEARLAIVVATGNEYTGLPYTLGKKLPSTRWPKGERSRVAAATNQMFLWHDSSDDSESELEKQFRTYLLLIHATAAEVRMELSEPTSMTKSGFVDGWGDRIILSSIKNDGPVIDISAADGDVDTVIDVPVSER